MVSTEFGSAVVSRVKEFMFAGDGVVLAGRIDYPVTPTPPNGFPLMFMLHHAGSNSLEEYQPYAEIALDAGYAVFRWDKRGSGRSGGGGGGSTTQDAVNAYEIALDQPNVCPQQVVIMAQGAGTGLLGSSYGLFARYQPPQGAILVSNLLDAEEILALPIPLQVVMGQNDWRDTDEFGEQACMAHNAAYKHSASFYLAKQADRSLRVAETNGDVQIFHSGARKAMIDWLRNLNPNITLI
jgi:uncharacterized protein